MKTGPLDMSLLEGTGNDDFKPRPASDTRKVPVEEAPTEWPRREPPQVPRETGQLGIRTLKEDVQKFRRLADEGNWSQPQLLRRMMRAYEACQNKDELGR